MRAGGMWIRSNCDDKPDGFRHCAIDRWLPGWGDPSATSFRPEGQQGRGKVRLRPYKLEPDLTGRAHHCVFRKGVSFFVSMDYAPVHISPRSADRRAQIPDFGGPTKRSGEPPTNKRGGRTGERRSNKRRRKRGRGLKRGDRVGEEEGGRNGGRI
jgi:hypothetical protein